MQHTHTCARTDPAPVQWGHHLQSGSWSHWCRWQKGWEYLTLCPGVLMFKTLGCLKNRNKDTCGMCIEKEPDRTVKKFTSMCLLICPRLSISLYIPSETCHFHPFVSLLSEHTLTTHLQENPVGTGEVVWCKMSTVCFSPLGLRLVIVYPYMQSPKAGRRLISPQEWEMSV